MSNELRYFDTLKQIARGYMTPKQIMRDSKGSGLDYTEYLEMSYENIQQAAALAIRGRRRPAPPPSPPVEARHEGKGTDK